MHEISTSGVTSAPSPKEIQVGRIIAAGETPELARELARIAYPWDRRDDLSLLMSVTASRCASYAEGTARG